VGAGDDGLSASDPLRPFRVTQHIHPWIRVAKRAPNLEARCHPAPVRAQKRPNRTEERPKAP